VVITIIGMLVALMVPAVNAAREAARRASCINQQRELYLAVELYTSSRGDYPSAVTLTGRNWVATILDNLGRGDLAKKCIQDVPADVKVHIAQFICPSDIPDNPSAAALSYVGNALIFTVPEDGGPTNRVSPSEILATAITPLLSERKFMDSNNPRLWFDTTAANITFIPQGPIAGVKANAQVSNESHPGGVVVTFCGGNVKFLPSDLLFHDDGTIWETDGQ
jgi:type II secretory pathway pseudopilin PulG